MPGFTEILGESPVVVGLRDQLRQLVRRYASARRAPPVLLLGETGVGKSLIARALHAHGPRADRPFVDVACPEIPETLMESEMFGVERGAFTDARHARPGRFAQADRGTIFLDEIGLLPDALQAKLLKIVEDQQLRPLGATASRTVDVWVIAATSEDLESAVRKRRFREDLYFRLAVVALHIPPLRDRGDDVVLLARYLLARACADYGLTAKTFAPEAVAALRAHRWPGNIRELGNVIERVALRAEGPLVTADVLGLAPGGRPAALDPPGDDPPAEIDQAVAGLERRHLLEALEAARGNVTRAARRLGLTRNTFRYRLRKHRITPGRAEAAPLLEAAAPHRPAAAPRWERRRVAFLRIAIAAGGDDAELDRRRLLEEVRQKVLVFGGTPDGLSPGGLTAIFGLDRLEDVARHAAHAAMAIRKLRTRGAEDGASPAPTLALHATHALLWTGPEGSQVDANARREAWQTLDQLIADGADRHVLVSAPTAALLQSTFQLVPGPDRSDGACLLLDGEKPEGPRQARRVFAGRHDELTLLRGRLDLARAGQGQVVSIAGEAGIGKSRLLLELRRTLDAETIRYLGARSPSYGRSWPLLPIVELLREAHGLREGEPADVVRAKVRARHDALGLPADDMMPYVLRVMGLDDVPDALGHLGPQTLHERTLDAFRAILLATARAGPLVIAVEDLHWMDQTSESYLAALIDVLVEEPILLLTTYRTGYRPPWSERSYVSELRLQPLARADAGLVLHGALERDPRGAPLPAGLAETLLDRADGNPFFIEELARALGTVTGDAAPIPESIEAVLLARIESLPDAPRTLLQAASVLGRDVSIPLLEAIVADTTAVPEHLRALQQLEYLHERRHAAPPQYRFKHALTQEAAYGSLPPERRRALHGRVVRAIEAAHADRLGEHVERLAHHAVRGQLWREAVGYLRQTGLRAAGSANHEAAGCFRQALELLDKLPERQTALEAIDLRLDLVRVLQPGADYRRCLDYLDEAATLAQARGERLRLGQARASQCLLLRTTGATTQAIEAGRQAQAIAMAVGDGDLAATASFFLGTAHQNRGEFRQAAACYRVSFGPLPDPLTREQARGLHRYASGARAWLVWALQSLGEFDEALAVGREAVRISGMRDDRLSVVAARGFLGIALVSRGDLQEGIALLEDALDLCRSHALADWLSPVTMHLGFAYARTGRLSEGIALLEEGDAHAYAIGAFTGHPARVAGLAHSYLLAGRVGDAAAAADRGLALGREQHQPQGEATCLRALGAAAAVAGDSAAAEARLTQAQRLAATLEMRPLVAHCHLDLGRLYRGEGRHAEARGQLGAAATLYREMGMQRWLDEALGDAASV